MTSSQFSYRKALIQDVSAIQSFQQAMAWETEKLKLDDKVLEQGVRAVFQNPELGQYHVCLDGADVIGSLLLTKEWSDWRNGTVWWLHSLYFKPAYRGQGLFSKMYHYVQELAHTEPNIRGIRLYVDHTNEKAQAVYNKLGMNGDHYRLFEWMKTF
ncbi:MAG: GNAT family N-acetyltransferase [Bdellovibrionaceae bacterium]|nr:GNAT family N-acetyltransferase [Pseudobdellovibrionaceae bacterium]